MQDGGLYGVFIIYFIDEERVLAELIAFPLDLYLPFYYLT
jgi:hypothetical protein